MGIIRRMVIFWDLALCSVAEVRLSATYQTARYSVPEDRQSSKYNASGQSSTLVSTLRMHI
jgi:hypothetical protein